MVYNRDKTEGRSVTSVVVFIMNEFVKNIGVGLAAKLIDFGMAKVNSPRGTTPKQRIEQIDQMLETLESEPDGGQPPARPPTEAPEPQNKASSAPIATITTQMDETTPEKGDVATACVPCALGHFSLSAGLLNEAVRFKKDGMTSNEIIDRVAKVLEEQNTLERVDLTSENLQASPEWERDIAEEALLQSRSLRHRLETIETIEELEQAAADTTAYYRRLYREWWKRRFALLGDAQAEAPVGQVAKETETLSLDEAKSLAAEEAAKEVEKRWYSQEKI